MVVKDAHISGHVAGELTITGYVVHAQPAISGVRDIAGPVEPDEPDTEVEVGYSRNALEPLTLVFQGRKVKLTEKPYCLFRYVYDLYRSEGQTEFDFAELSEALTGDDCEMSKNAIETIIRRITVALKKLKAPILLTYNREVLYIREKATVSQQQEFDLTAGPEERNVRGKATKADRSLPMKRRGRRSASTLTQQVEQVK
jgi:hypothetical protein